MTRWACLWPIVLFTGENSSRNSLSGQSELGRGRRTCRRVVMRWRCLKARRLSIPKHARRRWSFAVGRPARDRHSHGKLIHERRSRVAEATISTGSSEVGCRRRIRRLPACGSEGGADRPAGALSTQNAAWRCTASAQRLRIASTAPS